MEKAVVYARYSSHSQTEQSIEGQLAAAQKYALDHDYQIIETYCDRAKTGTNDNREEFQRMLLDTAKHQFTVIIVWKVDRFGRNREEIAFNKYKCKKNQVRIEYVAENISSGPEGVILESVLEGMAEYYSLQLSQNIKRGRLESAKKYHHISGRIALGYRLTNEHEYQIDPEGAKIVHHIFERIASGESLTEVTNWLNAEHCLTSQGNPYTKNSLPRILNNELYIGTYKYKDLVYAENVIPPIIERDLWDKAHEMYSKKSREPVSSWSYSDYLLTGKLYCGKCGSPMTGLSGNGKLGKKYNYYECISHRRHSGCDRKAIRADLLEKKILDYVQNTILTQPTLDCLVKKVYSYYVNEMGKYEKLDRLNKQLNELGEARNNLIKAVERGLDYAVVKSRLEDLHDSMSELENKIASEQLSKPLKLTEEHIKYFLSQFTKLDYSYKKYQKKLIDTFINRIELHEKELIVCLNYSENDKPFKCSTEVSLVELSKRQSNPIVADNVIICYIPLA